MERSLVALQILVVALSMGCEDDPLLPTCGDKIPRVVSGEVAESLWELGPHDVLATGSHECSDDPKIPEARFRAGLEDYDPLAGEVKSYKDAAMRVYAPATPGPHPLIVFMHGNDKKACVLFDDFVGIHSHWASWGYVVASIDASQYTCGGGGRLNVEVRAGMIHAAVETLHDLNKDPTAFLHGRIADDPLIVAGHSRGGGAALVAGSTLKADAVIALQAIDFSRVDWEEFKTDPSVPVVSLVAETDTDLIYPYTEPTEDRITGPYSWITIYGGIHAYTPDSLYLRPDDDPSITRFQQHRLIGLHAMALAGMHAPSKALLDWQMDHSELQFEDINFSIQGAKESREVSDRGTSARWNRRLQETVVVDDFDAPITGASVETNALDGDVEIIGFETATQTSTYHPESGYTTGQYGISQSLWLKGEGIYSTAIPALNLDSNAILVFRVKGPDHGADPGDLRIEIDTASSSESFDVRDYLEVVNFHDRFVQVEIPVGVSDIEAIRFVLTTGEVLIDDLRIIPSAALGID